ncbi:MAG TPA: alkyl hydroperoxide reductase [Acidimicrobiaceae bacterium]|nr:alkyl hydroperoxide reductase [Acidimicrobiaceae bacterium]
MAALSLAGVAMGACSDDSPQAAGNPALTAPISAADGTTTNLGEVLDQPLVVNLWATWCGPCVREMPAFDEVAGELDTVDIIGVNVGDDAADAAAFAADLGVSYPQYTDPDGALTLEFEAANLPATAFIAADGTVLEVHMGALTADELRSAIAKHFPESV